MKDSGNLTTEIDSALRNAKLPIDVTPDKSISSEAIFSPVLCIEVNFVQSLKAFSGILMLSGNTTFLRLEQLKNTNFPRVPVNPDKSANSRFGNILAESLFPVLSAITAFPRNIIFFTTPADNEPNCREIACSIVSPVFGVTTNGDICLGMLVVDDIGITKRVSSTNTGFIYAIHDSLTP